MNGNVLSGADQWLQKGRQHLRGKRFALLTNPTGVTREYVSTIEVCASIKEGQLAALFACEHGIRGERQAGVKFGDEVDTELGIPVYSLYGEHRQPTASMLTDLDAVVIDIQDLGIRFYTYLSTLVYMMEACAQHGVSLIVLDRPNPLGGVSSEGGLLQPEYRSMIGAWKMPIRTGMTIGEFALLVNSEMNEACDLEVIPLSQWDRRMTYPDTGLPWILPSPNMPTIDTVRVYAGNCFFEGTNLSEGRGTTKPFEMIGAPWLDARKTAKVMNDLRLPGVHFHPITFTPMFSKHQQELCHGIMTYVTDPSIYRSVSVGLHLLHYIGELHPAHFAWLQPRGSQQQGARWMIDLLTGSDQVRHKVLDRVGLYEILEQWEEEEQAWLRMREPYLLY